VSWSGGVSVICKEMGGVGESILGTTHRQGIEREREREKEERKRENTN